MLKTYLGFFCILKLSEVKHFRREKETCSFIGDGALDTCIKFRFLVWLLQRLTWSRVFQVKPKSSFCRSVGCSVLIKVYFHQNFHSKAVNLFWIKRCKNRYATEKTWIWWINLINKWIAKSNYVCIKHQEKNIFPIMKIRLHIKLALTLKQSMGFLKQEFNNSWIFPQSFTLEICKYERTFTCKFCEEWLSLTHSQRGILEKIKCKTEKFTFTIKKKIWNLLLFLCEEGICRCRRQQK